MNTILIIERYCFSLYVCVCIVAACCWVVRRMFDVCRNAFARISRVS